MIRKLLVTLILLACYYKPFAQQAVLKIALSRQGMDSTGAATITVYHLPDSSILESKLALTEITIFPVMRGQRYRIKISSAGYISQQKDILIADSVLLLRMVLQSSNQVLKEVTVVSKKKFLQQEDDKTVVDAEVLANSSTSAYEVLEKTPGAIVDQDGNVYLNSASPASIYINGREMKMSGDDIASLLKSLPAGSVSKIEILRTPSARYDAANSGGIVNIVLKKGISVATTGSLNVRVDQGVYNTVSSGFTINKSAGKFNNYFSYQYTNRHYFEDLHSNRLIKRDTLLSQQSSTQYSPQIHYIGAGFDVAMNKRWNLGYDLRLTANANRSNATSFNHFSALSSQQDLSASSTPISNTGHSLFLSNTISSKFKIDSAGSEWTNEITYSYSTNRNEQLYTDLFELPVEPSVQGQGYSNVVANIGAIKSDLSWKCADQWMMEAGFKISYAGNHNAATYFTQSGNGPQKPDLYQTSTFRYRENINSAYIQVSRNLFGFILKTGLRFENTIINGNPVVPVDTNFSIRRNDLFPYFYIRRYLFRIFGYPLTGNAIFRRSITRPAYDALSPSPRFIDPFTYDIGNTRLQPQFTTNYELNATYNDFPVFALGVNDTHDIFSKVTYQDDRTRIAYRTYDNLGHNKEVYARLFGGLPSGHRYFMYAGLQYNYIQYRGTYQQLPLNYNRGSWTLFTGHELKISPSLRVNVNAWMYIRGFRAFNELKNLGQLNASITKTVLDKKLSIILSGNDLLRTNIVTFHLQQGNVIADGVRTQDSQRVGVTLRYNFGISRKEEKKQPFSQPPETTESN